MAVDVLAWEGVSVQGPALALLPAAVQEFLAGPWAADVGGADLFRYEDELEAGPAPCGGAQTAAMACSRVACWAGPSPAAFRKGVASSCGVVEGAASSSLAPKMPFSHKV